MGTQVGRIVKEFVLQAMVDKGTPVEMTFHKHRVLCRLTEVTEQTLELEILDGSVGALKKGDVVHVFLHFQNNHHTFDSTCVAIPQPPPGTPASAKPRVIIAHPPGLTKNLQRKHERIRVPDGMDIYFLVRGQRVDLGFPRTRRPAPAQTAPASGTPEATARLDELVRRFKADAANVFGANRIVMYRERQPSSYEETLVSALGAVFWLPAVEEGVPETETVPDIPVITLADLRGHELALGTPEALVDGKIAKLLVSKRAQGIYAEATSPILWGDYVLGCVQISNLAPRRERITDEHVRLIWDFSRVLSNALERHKYIESGARDSRRYDAPVIDLSPSGLLFRHPSSELSLELLINTDLTINLAVDGRAIEVQARIRRKFTEPGEVYYGVQFVQIDTKDYLFLFEYLYGRTPTEQDENLWEGGSPPPKVDLFGDQT